MPITSGIMIAVVAVLLIHIESPAVTAKIKYETRRNFPFAARTIRSAIQRSSPCTDIAEASAKPPKKRKIKGSANPASADFMSITPASTPSTGTSSAVAASGSASVTHRNPMHRKIPSPNRNFDASRSAWRPASIGRKDASGIRSSPAKTSHVSRRRKKGRRASSCLLGLFRSSSMGHAHSQEPEMPRQELSRKTTENPL